MEKLDKRNYYKGYAYIMDTDEWRGVVADYLHGRVSQVKAAKKLGISIPTYIKYLKIYMKREIENGSIIPVERECF